MKLSKGFIVGFLIGFMTIFVGCNWMIFDSDVPELGIVSSIVCGGIGGLIGHVVMRDNKKD